MGFLIKVDHIPVEVHPANGSDFSAEEIHELIGGHFELVPLKNDMMLLVDEEGKIKSQEYNVMATAVAKENCIYPFNDFIAGDALLCNSIEVK